MNQFNLIIGRYRYTLLRYLVSQLAYRIYITERRFDHDDSYDSSPFLFHHHWATQASRQDSLSARY